MTAATLPRIKFLQEPTRPEWIELALNNLDTILLITPTVNGKRQGSR